MCRLLWAVCSQQCIDSGFTLELETRLYVTACESNLCIPQSRTEQVIISFSQKLLWWCSLTHFWDDSHTLCVRQIEIMPDGLIILWWLWITAGVCFSFRVGSIQCTSLNKDRITHLKMDFISFLGHFPCITILIHPHKDWFMLLCLIYTEKKKNMSEDMLCVTTEMMHSGPITIVTVQLHPDEAAPTFINSLSENPAAC